MSKLTVADAAEKLGVSKEAIHNRIRRGSLQSVVENGVKFVILDENTTPKTTTRRVATKKSTSPQADDRYYKLLEEQNAKLQEKIEVLEGETRSLRDQKEQMLIQEREKIEQIYKDKDEQLKNILNAISSKFMLTTPDEDLDVKEDLLEAEIDESVEDNQGNRLISLTKHLKSRDLSKKRKLKIQEKFKKQAKQDPRIITIGKKYYIDIEKYDYSDFSL